MSENDFFKSGNEILYGVNTIYSLVKKNAGRRKIFEIIINSNKASNKRVLEIIDFCRNFHIKYSIVEPEKFKIILKDSKEISQGIAATVSNYNYHDIEKYILSKKEKSILAILDGITDVGNFGSIIRNAHAFGLDGIIISKDRSVSVSSDVARISAGALEEIKIFKVTNIAKTISFLKKNSFWIYATEVKNLPNTEFIDKVKYYFPCAVVLGSEDHGIRRLTRDSADFLITIDTVSDIDSLNVSVASGIIFHYLSTCRKKLDD